MISKETFFDDYFSKIWCEWKQGKAWFHIELRDEWCVSTYKKSLIRVQEIKDHLKERGVSTAHVCIHDNDPKLEKFMEMHGFSPFASIDGNVYLIQEF